DAPSRWTSAETAGRPSPAGRWFRFVFPAPSRCSSLRALACPRQADHASLSSPINSLVSVRYVWGGTSRFTGDGLFLNTRPARSKVDPWQGHRKPPCQSSGRDGWAPASKRSIGEQPRCGQMPTTTSVSLLIERQSFLAYSGVGIW